MSKKKITGGVENKKIRDELSEASRRLLAACAIFYQSVPLDEETRAHEVVHPTIVVCVSSTYELFPLADDSLIDSKLSPTRMIKTAEELIQRIPYIFKAADTVSIACIFQAWSVHRKSGKVKEHEELINGPEPEDHPERKETLFMYLMSVDGGVKAVAQWFIKRSPGFRPTLIPWQELSFYGPNNPQPDELTHLALLGDLKRPPDSPLH